MLKDNKMQFATSQKYILLILDCRIDFTEYMGNKINKYKTLLV